MFVISSSDLQVAVTNVKGSNEMMCRVFDYLLDRIPTGRLESWFAS